MQPAGGRSLLLAGALLAALADAATPASPPHLQDNPQALPLENLARDGDAMGNYARSAASDARLVSGEIRNRLVAEAAEATRTSVRAMKDRAVAASTPIRGAVAESAKQATLAQEAADSGELAVKTGQLWGEDATKFASIYATKEIKDGFTDVIKKLQEWKMEVLHPPIVEARRAGYRAARPIEKAMQATEKRIAEYEQRATGLSNQAQNLRATAQGLAGGANSKQAGGDAAGAAKDMMDAHQMVYQAVMFETQAQKLMLAAQAMQVNIPAYQGAAQAAAHKEIHKIAPSLVAPPPVPPVPGMPGPPMPAAPMPVLLQQAPALRAGRRANPF